MKPFTIFDYETVRQWGMKRQFPLPPIEFLPQTGFVNGNFCAGFLYKTDSKFCWLEWVISNPDTDKTQRDKALDELIERLYKEAIKGGFKLVFTSVQHPRLIERYKRLGFLVTEGNMTNMVLGVK